MNDLDKDIWEHWPVIEYAKVSSRNAKHKVYLSPRNNNSLIYPGCISIMRNTKEIFIPNCYFKKQGGKLYGDSGALHRRKNGSVTGVAWDDPKTEISLYSAIMRRPKFGPNTVVFWERNEWIKIEQLPDIK
ncbi:hypothetical protein [Desulfopila sp. IMCC35008]|uniref:hypothetical protein n=1 Tax=Desulfopila sp. IMCC35008 TaxID=2653858 RepID=UPI0013D75B8A|nr:hypothetical protein [Desulfopila sp. IMCC35008]